MLVDMTDDDVQSFHECLVEHVPEGAFLAWLDEVVCNERVWRLQNRAQGTERPPSAIQLDFAQWSNADVASGLGFGWALISSVRGRKAQMFCGSVHLAFLNAAADRY